MEADFTKGVSVKVIHLNNLPPTIQQKDLGKRRLGAEGVVINASVPGFDSEAFRVEHREPFGEPCGETAIYFCGEIERIPDIIYCR